MNDTLKQWLLGAACIFTLCAILTATLWPFNPHPPNEVSWLEKGNGLLFGDYGTVLSSGQFEVARSQYGAPCSLEIWLQPGLTMDSNSIVAFSTRENPLQFRIRQDDDNMAVLRDIPDRESHPRTAAINLNHVFRQGTPLVIAITSDGHRAVVYLNGAPVQTSPQFGLNAGDFSGRLVLGNSPVTNNSWSGELRGLVIYDRELAASDVMEDYASWTRNGRVQSAKSKDVVALYSFDEHAGNVAHNAIPSAPDLSIPDHYLILHQQFLSPPWEEFRLNWSYVKDLIVNITGFIPLGFFFCAYFFRVRQMKRAVAVTILFGGAVSLSIEVLQAYLPTRDSGMTDIITNTLGAAVGAMLYSWRPTQVLLTTIGIGKN